MATIASTISLAAVLTGCGQSRQPVRTNGFQPAAPNAPAASTAPAPPSYNVPDFTGQTSGSGQGGDYVEVNERQPGQAVDINSTLVSGKRTIVEFYSPYCGPCMALRPYVQRLASVRPDLAVRSINVNRPQVVGIDWRSPVIRQNRQIRFLPYFMIYGPEKRLEAHGGEASNAVVDCIEKTFSKPR